MPIGFLFNHYEPHQVAHSAPIAFTLSQYADAPPVTILCSNRRLLQTVLRMSATYPGQRCRIERLRLPLVPRLLLGLFGRWWPKHKQLTLRHSIRIFKAFDVLVVPERTSLKLKDQPALAHLRLVRIRHGAGDRTTGLDETNNKFDLILASGQKMIDRLVAEGVDAAKCRIVGYPKFDYVAQLPQPPRLFANDKPIVVYNPHFKFAESSWPKFGLQVLAFFKQQTDYNLIFAPHIMLQRQLGFDRRSLRAYRNCANIHIDLGSAASIDMTYTRQADIYLGDVSSQVYEFLLQPRPCIFLNAHASPWQDNPAFAVWQAGAVLDDITQLPEALQQASARQAAYAPIQKQLFDYTFDLTKQPSAERAAAALQIFMAQHA